MPTNTERIVYDEPQLEDRFGPAERPRNGCASGSLDRWSVKQLKPQRQQTDHANDVSAATTPWSRELVAGTASFGPLDDEEAAMQVARLFARLCIFALLG